MFFKYQFLSLLPIIRLNTSEKETPLQHETLIKQV